MPEEQDTSTRTIASVAALLGLMALILGIVQSTRTGLIAEYAGVTKQVSEQNEAALLERIEAVGARVDALEAHAKKAAKAAAAAPAEPAEGE